MLLVSHRGNTIGANPEKENSPDYILEASKLFNVEIDVWMVGCKFYLGHDEPIYEVCAGFLTNPKFWCHAKNLPALVEMLKDSRIHCFWHQNDDVVLTSNKFLWTFPGKEIAKEMAIAVMPERVENWDISDACGVCSDNIGEYI